MDINGNRGPPGMVPWTVSLKGRADVTAIYAGHQARRIQKSHIQVCKMEQLEGDISTGGGKVQENSMTLTPL